MKKFLIVLMAVLLAFALIACDKDNTDDSKPNENNSTTSSSTQNSTTDSSTGTADKEEDKNNGSVLADALMKQLEETASAKLEFTLDLIGTNEGWTLNEAEEPELVTNSIHGIAKLTVVISEAENGYNLKVTADVKSDEGEGFEPDFEGALLYIVDGVIYTYNDDIDGYLVSEIPEIDTSKIEEIVGKVVESTGLKEEDFNKLMEELGATFIKVFNVVDNKGSFSADFKPVYDAIVAYLEGIDPTTYTIRNVVDDILALISEDLTAEALVATTEEMMNLTIAEYLDLIDTTVQEAYGKTLDELVTEIVNNETVKLLVAEIAMASGASEEEVEEALAMLASFTIDSVIPEEMLSVTLYDLAINMIMADAPSEEVEIPTLEEIVAMVNSILDMTLAQAEENFEIPFSTILSLPEMIEIEALNFKYDVNFTGVFQLVSVDGEYNVAMKLNAPSYEIEGKTDTVSLTIKVTVKLYEISKTAVEITAPEDKVLVNDIFDDDYYAYDDDGYKGCVSFYIDYDGTVEVDFEYDYVYYIANIELDAIDGYTVTIESAEYTNDDGEAAYTGEIVIVIDPVSNQFEITFSDAE